MPASTGPSPPYTTSPARPQNKRKVTAKIQRPTILSRKSTSLAINKLGSAKRESQYKETVQDDDEDETFLNFCANCEKQIKASTQVLYCSESCRMQDQNPSLIVQPSVDSHTQQPSKPHIPFSSSSRLPSPPLSPFTTTRHTFLDGPDIVAQASPTTSTFRTRGYFGSDGTKATMPAANQSFAVSVPSTYRFLAPKHSNTSTDALASLKELSIALDSASKTRSKISHSRSSVDYSSEDNVDTSRSSLVRSGSAVWSYMTSSGKASREQIAEQMTTETKEATDSYIRPKTPKDNGIGYRERRLELAAVRGVDRPLPPRTASYRPRSIDLLVPLTGTG